MNRRLFLKGMAATASGIMVPGHVLSGQYEFHQRVPGLPISRNLTEPPEEHELYEGPWMIRKDFDLANMRFAVGDNSSSGVSSYVVNMGQVPFVGDPMGFEPFDTNYSRSKWRNAASLSTDAATVVRPFNLGMAYYDLARSSGKFYLEIRITGSAHSGPVGFTRYTGTTLGSGNINFRNSGAYVSVGTFSAASNRSMHSYQGSKQFIPGTKNWFTINDRLQIWIDYDNGSIGMKRTQDSFDDYINLVKL